MREIEIEFSDNGLFRQLCGVHNRNLSLVEEGFKIDVAQFGNKLTLSGEDQPVDLAADALRGLYRRLEAGGMVDEATIDSAIRLRMAMPEPDLSGDGPIQIQTSKRTVEPRTAGQIDYVKMLHRSELTFGVGPAGTGKTYLAVAMGVSLFLQRKVEKIILSRPAVEAGERLGFLPGDMKEKVDPYLRPLYDAINDLWAGARIEKLMEEGRIEVAPLAFMRGRTLSDAFIVLDEAQNATTMQMRMFLTRLGRNSRMVVTGDPSQVDLPRGVESGLSDALRVLEGVKGVSVCKLQETDVVRHPLVSRIVGAYRKSDEER